ncbi:MULTISPECIES: class GN sortase [unclassified Ensifer]|uniref:class GN sortase n=1 Tax=unclassified Ensifer TaxID=2633371 RepID=UPI000812E493|nr:MULTISPECIES: class GN sortase [unclassified Ensifer]OCP09236.1 sortase, marine proteobacterial type [Ensifer sp. LC13]OCP10423.1 sortase, marine proteobacterial type [Ensifer sp. LC11]OCP13976.1 sortase, marine proteobacterial type [Ensifer sp. LC14]OCP32484.1 sortase, marine proteobacterial type [Ensifer sp. LC499]
MAAENERPEPRPGFLARLSAVETIVLAIIALIALAGLMLIGKGFYMKAKAEVSQVLLKRTFEAQLHGNPDGRPWPWADFRTAAEITAPRLNRSAIVLEGASGEALAFGPAWLTTTPQPGEEGTSVIAAHRDTHFRWLKDVTPGDLLVLTRTDGRRFLFRAGEGRVARWDESGINASASGHHLALATCWPFDAIEQGPMRYIVSAELIGEQRSGPLTTGSISK